MLNFGMQQFCLFAQQEAAQVLPCQDVRFTTGDLAAPVSSHIVVRKVSVRLVSHVFQLQQQDR